MKPFNFLVLAVLFLLQVGCNDEPGASTPSQQAGVQDETKSAAPEEKPEEKTIETSTEQPADPGLAIGEKAPDFDLKDQHGENRTLTDILESGQVALVFYRSADW